MNRGSRHKLRKGVLYEIGRVLMASRFPTEITPQMPRLRMVKLLDWTDLPRPNERDWLVNGLRQALHAAKTRWRGRYNNPHEERSMCVPDRRGKTPKPGQTG